MEASTLNSGEDCSAEAILDAHAGLEVHAENSWEDQSSSPSRNYRTPYVEDANEEEEPVAPDSAHLDAPQQSTFDKFNFDPPPPSPMNEGHFAHSDAASGTRGSAYPSPVSTAASSDIPSREAKICEEQNGTNANGEAADRSHVFAATPAPQRTGTAPKSTAQHSSSTHPNPRRAPESPPHSPFVYADQPHPMPALESGFEPYALEWEKLPRWKLHPLSEIPVLPEGWDWRIDDQNRLFYVDTYARGKEKRCFWHPPQREAELDPLPGWRRVCNLFGRVHWVHEESKVISYKHPHMLNPIHYQDNGIFIMPTRRFICREDGTVSYTEYWDRFISWWREPIDDADIACNIEPKVWENGLSDEAVAVRGELWWGNHQVHEWPLKLTKERPVLEPFFYSAGRDETA